MLKNWSRHQNPLAECCANFQTHDYSHSSPPSSKEQIEEVTSGEAEILGIHSRPHPRRRTNRRRRRHRTTSVPTRSLEPSLRSPLCGKRPACPKTATNSSAVNPARLVTLGRRRRGGNRQGAAQLMAGPCSVERRANPFNAEAVEASESHHPTRKRVQNPHLPSEFWWPRKEGLRLLALAWENRLSKSSPRSSVSAMSTTSPKPGYGYPANRHAQFPELPAPHRSRQNRQTHPLKARHERTHRGMAPRRRVHPGPWQSQRPVLTSAASAPSRPTRNTLDLSAVAIAKKETPLRHRRPEPGLRPGRSGCRPCCGAVAMGADGLIIEVHPNPAEAMSDGQQQVDFGGIKKTRRDHSTLPSRRCKNFLRTGFFQRHPLLRDALI